MSEIVCYSVATVCSRMFKKISVNFVAPLLYIFQNDYISNAERSFKNHFDITLKAVIDVNDHYFVHFINTYSRITILVKLLLQ